MKEGIIASDVFILFCTKGVLDRPFVKFEVDEALAGNKSILLVHEEGVYVQSLQCTFSVVYARTNEQTQGMGSSTSSSR